MTALLAQFAAGGVRHVSAGARISLSLDLGSLIAIMGVDRLRTNCKLPNGIAVILQLIQRVLSWGGAIPAASTAVFGPRHFGRRWRQPSFAPPTRPASYLE